MQKNTTTNDKQRQQITKHENKLKVPSQSAYLHQEPTVSLWNHKWINYMINYEGKLKRY